MFQQYQNKQAQQPEQAKPGLKDKLRRLKDQYPFKEAPQMFKFDRELPTGETPELGEEPTTPSEPGGTQKRYQPAKQAYMDVKFGLPRRGR
mgnify:CR=1 FL=1